MNENANHVVVGARRYRLTAHFTNDQDANNYLTQHEDEGVLRVDDDNTIYIAKCSDRGALIEQKRPERCET